MVLRGHLGGILGIGIGGEMIVLIGVIVLACLMVSCSTSFSLTFWMSDTGVLLCAFCWWILFCRLTTLGVVLSCDEEGSVVFLLPSLITLGVWEFSFSPSYTVVIELNNSASCLRAEVCRSLRSIGALFGLFLSAKIKPCAANLIVSPGPIAGILQCAGKNWPNLMFGILQSW